MNTSVRWTFVRKTELLNEIRAGRLSPVEALVQFGIGPEELSRWQELFTLGGENGLMAGQVQKYRQQPAKNNWGVNHALGRRRDGSTADRHS